MRSSQLTKPGNQDAAGRDPLTLLRNAMERRGVDAYVVPHSDEHQGEYIPPSAMRLEWLTGFSGSAGTAVVMQTRAALFVDGRYTLQAGVEVDTRHFEILHLVRTPPHRWLAGALAKGARLGYDPWLLTPAAVGRLEDACREAGAELVALEGNLVDEVWIDRPSPPAAPLVPHPLEFAGTPSFDKRRQIADDLAARDEAAAVLSAPDSVAWLLNVRGNDVPFAPLPLCFALIHADASVDLFVDPARASPELVAHLGDGVRLLPPPEFGPRLDLLKERRVRLDAGSAPAFVANRLSDAGALVVLGDDPCVLPKACKTVTELAGARAAHRRDGVALTRFLAWLSREGPRGGLTEIACVEHLEALRQEGSDYRGPSFPTIAGAGPNGAIVHYRVGPETDRRLEPGQLFLVDSGGQYLDGTTDVTRTVAIGTPGDEERHRFTLVLKGHVALARARFPEGTTGGQLDAFARRALWEEGLDYDHGTGHGVGSYLSVHEGPQRISRTWTRQELLPGMVVSNEPGYYKANAYGIRIESLVTVRPARTAGEQRMLEFETLTLAPIDRALIETESLDRQEREWIDAYHARVHAELSPLVDEQTARWLAEATRPL